MNYSLALLIFLFSLGSIAQTKTKVLLVATYHMGGTSDPVGVDLEKDDILGPKRQKEVGRLLDILERSGAEKIYVESLPGRQPFWDSIYNRHYTGRNVAMKNEIFQIGMKLAKRRGILQGVTCADWQQDSSRYSSERLFAEY